MKLVHVVAVARNGVIGRDGGLPWHLSDDLKYFKAVTMGKPMIMGRKTWQSIGRPLPGRLNIVVTRDPGFQAEGAVVCPTVEEAVAVARDAALASGVEEIAIIGGAQIYAQTIDATSRIYLTEVHAEVDGDAIFPVLDRREWVEVSRDERSNAQEGGPDYAFVVIDRKSAFRS